MKYVIVINGCNTGKDTFVSLIGKYLKVVNISSVDNVKNAATILGWNGRKSPEDRKFLSDLKMLSVAYNNQPFEYIKKSIEDFYNSDNEVLFLHIREAKEINKLKGFFKIITVLVRNPRTKKVTSNDSDANVEDYDYDFVLENDGNLRDLDKKAKGFAEYLMGD